jgi:hypothetical protein
MAQQTYDPHQSTYGAPGAPQYAAGGVAGAYGPTSPSTGTDSYYGKSPIVSPPGSPPPQNAYPAAFPQPQQEGYYQQPHQGPPAQYPQGPVSQGPVHQGGPVQASEPTAFASEMPAESTGPKYA